ncbi:MAG: hypothetical protein PHN88_15000 [Ignavibacteria bacterium]|nr:hypothetical protein [Ignavibacteria bacterium]
MAKEVKQEAPVQAPLPPSTGASSKFSFTTNEIVTAIIFISSIIAAYFSLKGSIDKANDTLGESKIKLEIIEKAMPGIQTDIAVIKNDISTLKSKK